MHEGSGSSARGRGVGEGSVVALNEGESHLVTLTQPGFRAPEPSPYVAPGQPAQVLRAIATPRAKATAKAGARRRAGTHATVSLVIPAKNEAANLPAVLAHIPKMVSEVILVDGLSTDVTQLMATTHRPDIRIVHEERPGKGYALQSGFEAAEGELIVAIDADGSMNPEEIPHFLHFLENGYDFVKGSRFVGGGGSFDITTIRRFGNRALLSVANRLHRTNFTDLCYGYFGFHRLFLPALGRLSGGFEIEAEVTLRAVKAGLRIAEVPSVEMPRRNGQSSLRSFPDGARVLRTVFRERSTATSRT